MPKSLEVYDLNNKYSEYGIFKAYQFNFPSNALIGNTQVGAQYQIVLHPYFVTVAFDVAPETQGLDRFLRYVSSVSVTGVSTIKVGVLADYSPYALFSPMLLHTKKNHYWQDTRL